MEQADQGLLIAILSTSVSLSTCKANLYIVNYDYRNILHHRNISVQNLPLQLTYSQNGGILGLVFKR